MDYLNSLVAIMTRSKTEKPSELRRFANKGIRDAINFFRGTPELPKITTPPQGSEAWYRDRLAVKLNGKIEVTTPSGRIDILTKTEVIEVKKSNGWKGAIGQVKCYGQYYPKHKLRIHLFGELTERRLKIIQTACQNEGITLSWE